jgi:hypothetical protein
MRAAVLHEYGATPRCGDFPEPRPDEGAAVVEVAAAALHHLDLLKASASERLERLLERSADAVVEPGRAALDAASRYARHVQVGHLAGLDLTVRATAVRSASLDLRGFNVAHPAPDVRRAGYLELTRDVARGDIVVDLEALPLERVDAAWERQRAASGGPKLVLLPRKEPIS